MKGMNLNKLTIYNRTDSLSESERETRIAWISWYFHNQREESIETEVERAQAFHAGAYEFLCKY